MEALKETRKCQECGASLHGRNDQKFCDAMCRTAANNRRRYEEAKNKPECISIIQKTLLNNYRILTELRKRGEQFSKLYLQDLGFSFRYLTSVTQQDGALRCYCFNQCYLLGDQSIILVADTVPVEQY
jgi:hypothetical protein